MTKREYFQAATALLNWFENQELTNQEATRVCAIVCGGLAKTDKAVEQIVKIMLAAREDFQNMPEEQS